MSLTGLLESTVRLVPLSRVHLQPVQQALAMLWNLQSPLDCQVVLPQGILEHLQWWIHEGCRIISAKGCL
jgi:hypothetical protein